LEAAKGLSSHGHAACMVEVATVSADRVLSDAGQPEVPRAPMATVVDSRLELGGGQPMFEDTALRGDATEEFREVLQQYPNATQAYRVGCVALSRGAGVSCASSAVSKIQVKNNGTVSWSESSSLRCIAGPHHGLPKLLLRAVPAGDTMEIALDLAITEGDGGRSTWAMCDERGEPFGPLILFETVCV